MDTKPYLTTYRKRRSPHVALSVAALMAVLVAAGVGVTLALGERVGSATDTGSPPARATTETVVLAPAADDLKDSASHDGASATQSAITTVGASKTDTPSAPASDAHARADSAADKASVAFPGAPAVKPQSIASARPKRKYIAITFDDGYGFDREKLALLQKYDARCTTFVLGRWAEDNKKALRRLDRAGFEIANHGWDHSDLTDLSDAQILKQLERTQRAISAVTGNQAPYMRPPYGATNSRVKTVAARSGYKVVMWSRSFADTSPKASPERSYRSVMEARGGVRPGDIIVCHWGSDDTFKALERILPELKAQGYEFVTVSELLADSKRGD